MPYGIRHFKENIMLFNTNIFVHIFWSIWTSALWNNHKMATIVTSASDISELELYSMFNPCLFIFLTVILN